MQWAKRSGEEKVSGPPGQDVPYHVAITKLATHPWEIRARLGYGLFSGQQKGALFSPISLKKFVVFYSKSTLARLLEQTTVWRNHRL